jgi:hypothetical protein
MPDTFVSPDTSLLAKIEGLKRADTGADIEAGVTVTCEVYTDLPADPLTDTPVGTVTLTHQGSGEWRANMASIATANMPAGSLVDVRWLVDGGPGLRSTWWERRVRVSDRTGTE